MPGYCKVCASPRRKEIDAFLSRDEPLAAIERWTVDQGAPITRKTIRQHRDHATHPQTTFVEDARRNPTVRRTTSSEFLQTIVDMGAQRIEDDPSQVGVDHALRAAQILEGRKDKGGEAMNILILALTGRREPPTIVGEYRELIPAGKE